MLFDARFCSRYQMYECKIENELFSLSHSTMNYNPITRWWGHASGQFLVATKFCISPFTDPIRVVESIDNAHSIDATKPSMHCHWHWAVRNRYQVWHTPRRADYQKLLSRVAGLTKPFKFWIVYVALYDWSFQQATDPPFTLFARKTIRRATYLAYWISRLSHTMLKLINWPILSQLQPLLSK